MRNTVKVGVPIPEKPLEPLGTLDCNHTKWAPTIVIRGAHLVGWHNFIGFIGVPTPLTHLFSTISKGYFTPFTIYNIINYNDRLGARFAWAIIFRITIFQGLR